MIVFGGITSDVTTDATGRVISTRRALGDVFSLSLLTRDWEQVATTGQAPTPRYECCTAGTRVGCGLSRT